jgi:hypothetical protein
MNTYSRGLTQFEQFLTEFCLQPIWPFSVDHILRFITHLYQPKITHSTISCYLSGITFYSKINRFKDSTQEFVVRKALEGAKRIVGAMSDSRLPITRDILISLITVLPSVCNYQYEIKLFKAAFLVAFHGLLRIGELALNNGCSRHVLLISNLAISNNHLKLKLSLSKTD